MLFIRGVWAWRGCRGKGEGEMKEKVRLVGVLVGKRCRGRVVEGEEEREGESGEGTEGIGGFLEEFDRTSGGTFG